LPQIDTLPRLAHRLHFRGHMGAFDNFLRKRGYAKLDRYGLVLTEDDRVLSTRAAVLDDGLGGKVVGWVDGDLAAAELQPFGAPPVPRKQVQAPPMPRPAPVAAREPEGEDEWEWEIAMARARAAAEEVQTAAASVATSFTAPAPRKAAAMTVPTAFAKGSASHPVPAPSTDPMASWPGTEPLGSAFSDVTRESPTVVSPAAKTLAVARTEARRTPAHGTARAPSPSIQSPAKAPIPSMKSMPSPSPRTVIPVPSLPVAARPSDVRPVMAQSAAARRFARGTVSQREPANSDRDTTVVSMPAFTDDHTSPYVTLPAEVKPPTGYAHTKRVAAKQR
jgi:hypothetical protein